MITPRKARELIQRGTGRGIRIAILDSGIEAGHPALGGLSLRDDVAIVPGGVQLTVIPGEAHDVFGHGTAVAAIIRAVAPEAEIGSFRVLGERLDSRTLIIREGVRQALERGYHILNCSFGCGVLQHVLHYKEWVDEAYVQGVHIVAACNNFDFTKPEWPAFFSSVITANLTRVTDPLAMYYRPGTLVEFAARGCDVEVPWLGATWKKQTGSSYAAPHIAGILARLLEGSSGLRPLQAKALLQEIARPWTGDMLNAVADSPCASADRGTVTSC